MARVALARHPDAHRSLAHIPLPPAGAFALPSRAVKPRLPLLALALTALSVLTLQISLTRVFSLLIWYHFAFLAVAAALIGFTGGGLAVQLRPALREGDLDGRMAKLCLGASGAIVLALVVASRLPFEMSVLASPGQFACFVALVVAVLVPFVLGGTVVAAVLSAHGATAARLYAADLVGSGVGCGLSVIALDRLGGGAGGVMTAAVAMALASLAFARRSPAWRTWGTRLAAGSIVVLVALTAWGRDPLRGPFYLPNAKLFPRVPKEFILSRSCDSTACVDLFFNPWHHGIWGVSRHYNLPLPTQVGVVIDAWAITSIFEAQRRPDGTPELHHPIFDALLPAFPHLVDRARGFRPQRMLVIGAGGGVDVRAAVHFGIPRIEGVELNRNIMGAVAGPFDRFSGGLYHHPSVRITHAEGRHYLRRSPHRYDLLQLSGVDTYAASQAGAFALSENFLYTTEAFKEYLQHLTPNGTLTLTRWLYYPPRHTLRLCAIAVDAYRELGLGDAAERMVILSSNVPGATADLSLVLARRTPFGRDELRAIRAHAEARGFAVVWSPDSPVTSNQFERYFRSPDRAAFIRDYHFRIDPSTDDSPFFFEYNRFSRLRSSREMVFGAASGQTLLVVTFLLSLFGGALLLFVPPWIARRRRPDAAPMSAAWTAYFLALGLGYIAVETVFIPRYTLFLGNPVYALSVVLFALLVSSGVGSALAPSLIGSRPRRLAAVALAVAGCLVLYRFGLQAIFVAGLGWPIAARVALSVALIALPGTLMGMPFPTGLTFGSAPHAGGGESWVARAWVLNGYASVVGSVGAMIAAMAGGFSVVLLLAAVCYVVAAAMAWRSRT